MGFQFRRRTFSSSRLRLPRESNTSGGSECIFAPTLSQKRRKDGAPSITVSALSRDTSSGRRVLTFPSWKVLILVLLLLLLFAHATKARLQNPAVEQLVPPTIYSIAYFRP